MKKHHTFLNLAHTKIRISQRRKDDGKWKKIKESIAQLLAVNIIEIMNKNAV